MTGKGLNRTAGNGEAGASTGRPRRQAPGKTADPAYLERAALHYLERFAATKGHLTQVLRRKIRRRGLADGVSEAQAEAWIEALVEKLVRLGYMDDWAYAQARARSLLDRGKPLRAVRQGLMEKSVPHEMIERLLADLADTREDTDLLAAIRYVRRRRIGPVRPRQPADPAARHKSFQKDMATLARNGFSFEVARRVLEAEGTDGLDTLEDEARAGN